MLAILYVDTGFIYSECHSPSTFNNYNFIFQKLKRNILNTVTWDSNLQYSYLDFMGRVANPGGDLLDDLLTPCAGTLRYHIQYT